jgi:hypothetical protein
LARGLPFAAFIDPLQLRQIDEFSGGNGLN